MVRSQEWRCSLGFATNWNCKGGRITCFLWTSYPNMKFFHILTYMIRLGMNY